MKTYHVGLERGTGKVQCWNNGHLRNTVIVHLAEDRDYLSPDIFAYVGMTYENKAHFINNKADKLQAINALYKTSFTHIIID